MTDNQKLISALIDDFNGQIAYYASKVEEWTGKKKDTEKTITALALAIEQLSDDVIHKDAIDVLLVKKKDTERYLQTTLEYLQRAEETYEAIKKAKRPFMEVIWKNCEHEYEYESTDYHKNEDSYRCKICGKVT